ncbi:unnamed protein product [Pleuronectes platessa]|uniref:Uncharacterized protein n=1 Tax=Pleuronectes platessa TaxID=8262 RepID=A0A9N7VMB1_PLEPL|nr:unnamed protein product [Pleuronectes platessa]
MDHSPQIWDVKLTDEKSCIGLSREVFPSPPLLSSPLLSSQGVQDTESRCLPARSVVRGLLFLRVGEGHVLQMDMSCGAMPSQLHWSEPPGAWSRAARQTNREGNYLWPGEPGCSLGQARKKMDRVRTRWRGDRERGSRVRLMSLAKQIYSAALGEAVDSEL